MLKLHTSVIKKTLLISFLIGVNCLFLPIVANAEGEESQLSVKAELPENQLSKDAGYYDLKVMPGETQELVLKVYNMSDKETTAKIEINPAYTGASGSFNYSIDASKRDESMKIPLSDIAKTDEHVSIPGKSEANVKIRLVIPMDGFDGIIFGGIRVTDIGNGNQEVTKNKEQSGSFSISNKYAYTIAVRLREKEEMPKSDLKIKTIAASQVVGRNAVKVNLQNPTPTIIDKMTYDAKIMRKGKSETLHEQKVSEYRIAPNTNFDFPINWDNKPFQAGDYQLEMTAKSEETGQLWEFKQEFTISAKEAKELNDKAIDLEKDYTKYIIYGVIIAVILIVIIILLAILSRKRKEKQRKKKSNNQVKRKSVNNREKDMRNGTRKKVAGIRNKSTSQSRKKR